MMKFAVISALCVASVMAQQTAPAPKGGPKAGPKVSNDGGDLRLNAGAGEVCFTEKSGEATGCMADLATKTQMAAAKAESDKALADAKVASDKALADANKGLAAVRAKLAAAEETIAELEVAVDVKVKANTNLTEANAGKIADIEQQTAGNLALLPAILKCAELGQVYSTKSKKCSSATSVKCPVLSNLNPLVAADSKLLSASKHLLATENVTQGAIVIDANVCAHNNHFGGDACAFKCRPGYAAVPAKKGDAPEFVCGGDSQWIANFKCELLKCPSKPTSKLTSSSSWKIILTDEGLKCPACGKGTNLGSTYEITCNNGKGAVDFRGTEWKSDRSVCQEKDAKNSGGVGNTLVWTYDKIGGKCGLGFSFLQCPAGRGTCRTSMVVKHVLKHCSGKTIDNIRFSGTGSWAKAQARCKTEKDCWGVYDSGCRGKNSGYVMLCSKQKLSNSASRLSRSGSSCVFQKPPF